MFKFRLRRSRVEFLANKELARSLVNAKIEHFNQTYGFMVKRVSIRNQRSRWGSCSKKGNLNFNYRLVLLPPLVADYIIVHELCHLGEFNHSKKFWALVAKAIPNHKQLKKDLRGRVI